MFRWAMISNSTISPLVVRLKKELGTGGAGCEFFVSEHGDTSRQVFSPASELYAFKPDLVMLYLDLQQLKPRIELSVPFESREANGALIAEVVLLVSSMAKALRDNTHAVILVNGFPVMPRTVLGIGLDHHYRNSVRRINLGIQEALGEMPQCHYFDCESLWLEVGFKEYDRRFDMIAQFPFGVKMQQAMVSEWMRYFRALQGLTRKCVVLDLDNTLWGGILGEDGPDGIQMGDTPEGRPFRLFQHALKALNRRGVLLAISSKNNQEEVMALFRQHPELVLRETDFAAMQINWEDKATNVARISRDLNIGLGHMVFLDDNPGERAWVREQHAEVLVPEMPEDRTRYVDILCDCQLDNLGVTDEDLKRSRMYWEERQRRALQAEAPSFEDFLRSLNLEVEIEPVRPETLERAAQLCQRTNQFNVTTRRHNAEQLGKFSKSPDSRVLIMRARDRFGDYGWSGLVIATVEGDFAVVDSFLLSCRVLGKNAEFALFAALAKWAAERNCTQIRGFYIPTSKNAPCKDFFAKCGLKPVGASEGATPGQVFEAGLSETQLPQVDFIKTSVNP